MPHRHLIASLVIAAFAGHAMAQEVRLYRASEAVDPHDVARILDQSKHVEPVIKMRSIRLLDDAPGSRVTQGVAVAQVAYNSSADAGTAGAGRSSSSQPSSLALPVQFGFDSAEILPSARAQLDALAAGIRLLPPAQTVVIEGHTDAAGSDQYNEQLSLKRAYSVKRYLVASQGIAPERLIPAGMGKSATLRGHDPYAPENRRVQFHGE